ncbi:MAG: HD domain-containing protein [Deltaproteobacteria bacterium]|nr:MAG: HD domain-containing protein [Deltaproteobacteria bacterium]
MSFTAQQKNGLTASLQAVLRNSSFISELLGIAAQENHRVYLVGGFIRDSLVGRSSKDIDLVTARVKDLASSLATKAGYRCALIDRKFGTVRLFPSFGHHGLTEFETVDLSPLRGESIEEDLAQRDFTMNAIAVDLSRWHSDDFVELIDPLEGIIDLLAGRVRACKERTLVEDPLRILRAFRLLSTNDFQIESQTRVSMVQMSQGLGRVAVERIRDELLLILSAPDCVRILRMMDGDNFVKQLLPEFDPMRGLPQSDHHHQDVWQHSLSALETLETFLGDLRVLLGEYVKEAHDALNHEIAGGRTRQLMLKLAVLIHDIGKPACRTTDNRGVSHYYGHELVGARLSVSLCSRLRLSNKEIEFVSRLVRQQTRVAHLFRLAKPPKRALSRFFRLGPGMVWPLIILFASDFRVTRRARSSGGGDLGILQERIQGWLDFYSRWIKPREGLRPLVTGHDLTNYLQISPGPNLGKLLNELGELQWEGRINSRDEALKRAAQLLKKWEGR